MAPSVPEFYAGKSIFITGGTGFVGKLLVEKLLRACPDLKIIYLLLREKRGVSSEERLQQLCESKAFDLLREKNLEFHKKLRLVPGDITLEDLGVSDDDREELMENCNVVFHSAACVRFDQRLKDAVNMNIQGTLRVLTLAESMKKLESFVHVSTAYCRCELPRLCERLYRAAHAPRRLLELVQWMDDDTLQYLEPKLIASASEPNTYSYTKAVTEDLVDEFSNKFPIAIVRPSIVIAAWKEPKPGWVDTINGPTGIVIGSGKGVIRTMLCEASYTVDAIGVDIVVNGCILVAYVTAIDKLKETQVYNLTMNKMIKVSWGTVLHLGEKWVHKYPFTVALWYPGGNIRSYWLSHQISKFFTHLVPAYLIDGLLFLLRRERFMVKLQSRISLGLETVQYYTMKEWNFDNQHFLSLHSRISAEDQSTFYFVDPDMDLDQYFRDYVLGIRQYCCKEDPENLPRARRLHRIRYIADRAVKVIFLCLLAWFFCSKRQYIFSSVEMLDNVLKRLSPMTIRS